ncbi:hypothetical protein JCM1393_11750 [Clostridium carnis]
MALGILSIIFLVILIVSIALIFAIFYKKGFLLKNKFIFISTIIFLFILTFMSYTGLPANFILQKSIVLFGGLLTIISIILYFLKKDMFVAVKTLLILSLLINLGILFI